MAKKTSSRTKKSAQRATANKAIAAASSVRAAKVTKAVHLAIAKALPNVQVISPNVGGVPQLISGQGGPAPATQGAKGPGTIEPKAYLVFVIPL